MKCIKPELRNQHLAPDGRLRIIAFCVLEMHFNPPISLIGREGSSKSELEERTIPSNTEAPPVPSTEDNNNNNNNPEVSMASLPHPPHKDMRHPMHHMGGHHPMYPDVINGSKGPFCHYGPEFPPVMLAHIYQEELLKLIGKYAMNYLTFERFSF